MPWSTVLGRKVMEAVNSTGTLPSQPDPGRVVGGITTVSPGTTSVTAAASSVEKTSVSKVCNRNRNGQLSKTASTL